MPRSQSWKLSFLEMISYDSKLYSGLQIVSSPRVLPRSIVRTSTGRGEPWEREVLTHLMAQLCSQESVPAPGTCESGFRALPLEAPERQAQGCLSPQGREGFPPSPPAPPRGVLLLVADCPNRRTCCPTPLVRFLEWWGWATWRERGKGAREEKQKGGPLWAPGMEKDREQLGKRRNRETGGTKENLRLTGSCATQSVSFGSRAPLMVSISWYRMFYRPPSSLHHFCGFGFRRCD